MPCNANYLELCNHGEHCEWRSVSRQGCTVLRRRENSLLSSQRHPLMRSPHPDATTVGLSARCTRQLTLPAGRYGGPAEHLPLCWLSSGMR